MQGHHTQVNRNRVQKADYIPGEEMLKMQKSQDVHNRKGLK